LLAVIIEKESCEGFRASFLKHRLLNGMLDSGSKLRTKMLFFNRWRRITSGLRDEVAGGEVAGRR
jgi:hypothetical protein